MGLTGRDGAMIRAQKLKLVDSHDPNKEHDVLRDSLITGLAPCALYRRSLNPPERCPHIIAPCDVSEGGKKKSPSVQPRGIEKVLLDLSAESIRSTALAVAELRGHGLGARPVLESGGVAAHHRGIRASPQCRLSQRMQRSYPAGPTTEHSYPQPPVGAWTSEGKYCFSG